MNCATEDHKNSLIIGICLSKNCQNPFLSCSYCFQQLHTNHKNDCKRFRNLTYVISQEQKQQTKKAYKDKKHSQLFKIYDLIINKKYDELNQQHLKSLRLLLTSQQQQEKNGISIKLNLKTEQNNKQSIEDYINTPQKKLKVQTNIKNNEITDEHLLVKEAGKLYQQQNYKKALRLYSKAIKINDQCANIFFMKGQTLFRLKHYKRALTFINKAIKLKSGNSSYLIAKSQTLFMLQNIKKSLKFCDKAIELQPENSYLYFNKGQILKKMNQQKQAMESFQLASQKNPNAYQNWFEQGRILSKQKDYEQALACLNKALQIKPDNDYISFFRSYTLLKLKKYFEALESVNLSLQLKPNFIQYQQGKAYILSKMNRISQARYLDQRKTGIISVIKNQR